MGIKFHLFEHHWKHKKSEFVQPHLIPNVWVLYQCNSDYVLTASYAPVLITVRVGTVPRVHRLLLDSGSKYSLPADLSDSNGRKYVNGA